MDNAGEEPHETKEEKEVSGRKVGFGKDGKDEKAISGKDELKVRKSIVHSRTSVAGGPHVKQS